MASTWSQGQWNLGTWSNSVSGAVITGIDLTSSLGTATATGELNRGWGRSEWNTGPWGTFQGAAPVTGEALTTSLSNVSILEGTGSLVSATGSSIATDVSFGFGCVVCCLRGYAYDYCYYWDIFMTV